MAHRTQAALAEVEFRVGLRQEEPLLPEGLGGLESPEAVPLEAPVEAQYRAVEAQ